MKKRAIVVVIAILCSMSLAYQFEPSVNAFKVEQMGVRM